jgi:hypothetical protein
MTNGVQNQPSGPVAGAMSSPTPPNVASVGSNVPIDNTSLNDNDLPKYFFQEKYVPLNVKGNFLTLCACPKNVELGEWLAHQSRSAYPLTVGRRSPYADPDNLS